MTIVKLFFQIEEARRKAEAQRLANKEAEQMRLAAEQAEMKQKLSEAASKGRDEKVGWTQRPPSPLGPTLIPGEKIGFLAAPWLGNNCRISLKHVPTLFGAGAKPRDRGVEAQDRGGAPQCQQGGGGAAGPRECRAEEANRRGWRQGKGLQGARTIPQACTAVARLDQSALTRRACSIRV